MIYEIGLSGQTIESLKQIGGFSVEKFQEFYPVVVKQVVIQGIGNVILLIASLSLVVLFIILFINICKRDKREDEPFLMFLAVLVFIFTIFLIISTIEFFAHGAGYLFNPEYAAVKNMISMARGF